MTRLTSTYNERRIFCGELQPGRDCAARRVLIRRRRTPFAMTVALFGQQNCDMWPAEAISQLVGSRWISTEGGEYVCLILSYKLISAHAHLTDVLQMGEDGRWAKMAPIDDQTRGVGRSGKAEKDSDNLRQIWGCQR